MKYQISKISSKSTYTLEEVSNLFSVDVRSVSRWIKEGLELLESTRRPYLIMGADLKSFIVSKRKKYKVTLKEYEFYCLKCRKAVTAKKGSLEVKKTGRTIGKRGRDQLTRKGICRDCNSSVYRLL